MIWLARTSAAAIFSSAFRYSAAPALVQQADDEQKISCKSSAPPLPTGLPARPHRIESEKSGSVQTTEIKNHN
jgi:hypothetical protein